MRPPVGDRKLHAFALARVVIQENADGTRTHSAGPITKAWFGPAEAKIDTNVRPGYFLLRSPYVCPSDRYPRQALRRGWTRISEVKR